MTDLVIRTLPFRFDESVPFQWNRENPEFGLVANAIGLLIVSMEKMIVSVVHSLKPRLTDPAVAAEAHAFLRQEALHSRAHQAHLRALLVRHPGLQETIDTVDASFRELERTHSTDYLVAYIAALEGTFPPMFKLMLDHRDSLFENGDERVASLFAWHFVEEIEHRSSALILYDAVVADPNYRLRVFAPAFAHAAGLLSDILEAFGRIVPFEDRLVDVDGLLPSRWWLREIVGRLPVLGPRFGGKYPTAFHAVPWSDLRATFLGLLRSQLPNHRPADEPIPAWAETWARAHERGEDMTRFLGVPATSA